jgi:hypothetical protein
MKMMDRLRRAAVRQGWTVVHRPNGHLVWKAPSGAKVYSSCTPAADAPHKHLKLLKSEGFQWPSR